MHEILATQLLAPRVTRMVVSAPEIARKRQAGQFIILRTAANGERIPLTIADADPAAGTLVLVFQEVGKTTAELAAMCPGERLHDLVGPLGRPTHVERFGHVVVIGGGIGIAPAHPITQAMRAAGNRVTAILGARTRDLLIMESEMRAASDRLLICTDDGSYGEQALVTGVLSRVIGQGPVDLVVAIGPAIMMKFCCETTRPHAIPTLVSLNTIMVDGTGMCGACRVTVGGQTRFVCVHGPEFNGHEVDFDEMMKRQRMYVDQEKLAYTQHQERTCGCGRGGVHG